MFNPTQFLTDIVSKNAEAIKPYFTPDAIICWHDSNEQFTLEEFIKANCEYPSTWTCSVERIEKLERGFAITAQLNHPEDGFYVKYVGFIELNDKCLVQKLDEWFVAIEDVPQWRKDMKIGRPIQTDTTHRGKQGLHK